ncbi:MAG: hypothetical protein AB7S71_09125 [Dongiaceae bacterium]
MRWVGALVAAAVMAWGSGGEAAELGRPAGQVVLTVAGAIESPNRGPFDEFEDGVFKYHERRFEKAASFDLAMLEGLGMQSVTVAYSGWPKAFRFEGPWLKDVLAAAGASGRDISALALDGYASEISAADLDAYDWLLAVKRDGRYLDIGQRGPLWIVYARRDGQAIGEADELRWPWAVFLIEAK